MRNSIRYAGIVYLLRDNNGKTEVLLQQRGKGTFGTGYWDGSSAGHVEKGESITACAIREAQEEIGIEINEQDIIFSTVIHLAKTEHPKDKDCEPYINAHFFVLKYKGTPSSCERDKCDDLRWFDINNLPEKMFADRREAIHNYLNKKTYSEIGW